MDAYARRDVFDVRDAVDVIMRADRNPYDKPLASWTKQEVGRCGEDVAAAYLAQRGFEIVERNWRCSFGEVDIIAVDDDELVMVEVKTRVAPLGDSQIEPEEAVGYRKRRRYNKLALTYLSLQIRTDIVRFDVVAVRIRSERDYELRHLLSAYDRG